MFILQKNIMNLVYNEEIKSYDLHTKYLLFN
jgi:hypothetical protein